MIEPPQNPTGYLSELFLLLQEKLQFKYNLTKHVDCYGEKLSNGSYSCMYGTLQRGESNWSIADCAETVKLSSTFDLKHSTLVFAKENRDETST